MAESLCHSFRLAAGPLLLDHAIHDQLSVDGQQ